MKKKSLWNLTDDGKDHLFSDCQDKILQTLTYRQTLTFNQLWNKEGESNKFAYHLKKLEKEGLVEKTNNHYRLTGEGKKTVAYHMNDRLAMLVVAIVITKGNKYLMLDRTKEPFYGYVCLHAGKLGFSKYILETAEEILRNDTGLKCDLELKGLFSSKTFENNTQAYHHQVFIVRATNPEGNLIQRTVKGTSKWMTLSEIKAAKMLPNIPHILDIAKSNRFWWVEMDRLKEGDSFEEIKIKKSQKI